MNIFQTRPVLLHLLFPLLLLLSTNLLLARELNIPSKRQEKTNWCWAACGQMVLQYYGVSKTQTQLAEWVFVLAENSTIPLYNTVGNRGVNRVLSNFAGTQIGNQYFLNGTLSPSNIITEIDYDRPITILGQSGWGSPPEYHIMNIIGYINNSSTNPTIILNDPYPDATGGRREASLTYVQKTAGVWEWQESLRLQKSGINNTGIADGVGIASTTFTYTQPAVARTYTGNFVRASGSYAFATQWNWTLSFSHASGDYVAASFNGPDYPTLSTTWYAPSFNLPTNYAWNYTSDGAIIGELKLSCIDTDGFDHFDKQGVFYYPPNPYPMSIVFAYSSVAGPYPDVKAHQVIVLQDYQINAGANITFKAGETIVIRDNVTIQNGSISNFIVDPSIR